MAWCCYITAADHWYNSEDKPLDKQRWLEVVRAQPDFDIVGNRGDAIWRGHPHGDPVEFYWREPGHVTVQRADEVTRDKMEQLARLLDARFDYDH